MADHSIWLPGPPVVAPARDLHPLRAILTAAGNWHLEPLRTTTPEQARVMELEAEVSRLKAMLNAVDDGSGAAEPASMDEAQANRTPVDHVIDMLDKRMIVTPDRTRLRRALDRADAPQGGRAGADAGLGRAIGKPATFAAGVYVGR